MSLTTNPIEVSDGLAPLTFTTFTSEKPTRLTKILSLADDGSLQKQAAANMCQGIAQRTQVWGLDQLEQTLAALKPCQAVSWGVCTHADVRIVPERDLEATQNAVARTREHFAYSAGPGVMMLDHDGAPNQEFDVDTLRQRLIEACPPLSEAPMLWRPSVSAGVQTREGQTLSGLTRHRIYIPVLDASHIPSAGKALCECLWAAGYGWYEVSRAGTALDRSLIDASVWQPERLDFCSPPILRDGLSRPHTKGVVYGDPMALFDLKRIVADADVLKRAAAARKEQRAKVHAACMAQRERWANARAPELVSHRSISLEKALDTLNRASNQQVLTGDFLLSACNGELISVAEMLDNPDRWHNARFADPLDPNDDDRVAMANLKCGAQPYVYSHRHGGMRFELMRQLARVRIGRGHRVAATDAVLAALKIRGELFDFGEGSMVHVSDGKARPVSPDWLTDHMGRVCHFYSESQRRSPNGEEVAMERAEDAPPEVARAILAKHGARELPKLVAVITAPTLRMDGSILDEPGHDQSSGLLYYSEHINPRRVPKEPDMERALAALHYLWQPFRQFPLVDDVDRGVVLQGLLTAALRASLPTAPGIGLDAPAAGSGKTLLARCIGMLATGTDPAILPPADGDDETRKRLFAALREGHRVVLWDNLREPLGCASLDAFLTAPNFADRILGSSQTASMPNRALFIATGNNLRLSSDTCRRVLLARLDPMMEKPYTRDFDFDPAQMVATHRLNYVIAALTIIRAYIVAGRPKAASGRTASFEAWDDWVRQPLCWLAQLVREKGNAALPSFADPMLAAERAFEHDPETSKLAALLEAWHAKFGTSQTTVATAIRCGKPGDALNTAMDEIAGQSGHINARILGRWLERMTGRIVNGKHFLRVGMRTGVLNWRINKVQQPSDANPLKHTKATTDAFQAEAQSASKVGLVGSGGIVNAALTSSNGTAASQGEDESAF